MHPLLKYLQRNKMSQLEFSKMAKIDNSNLNRIIRGERQPRVELAKRLAAATGNKVKWTAFYDLKRAA